MESIKTEEIISFLSNLSYGKKQNTKRCRYMSLSAFFNLMINTFLPDMKNPCKSPAAKNLFKKPKAHQWTIFDKDTIDEAISRTIHVRNRLMLELMARGGMRISEVLGLTPADIKDRKLLLHDPKSGREQEVVFIPQKLSSRLINYVRDKDIQHDQRIFPLSYAGGRKIVVKVGDMLGINLRPHDLRRHAATYASRAGVPIEIISKIILRHSDLSTTQQYLGKVSDIEAIRWIENLHG
ncbi:MAG: site-specific integrase [Desulfobulbaceae bacterium]|nr:site-specific integrase [Desulfobulbaceae bacterium]